MVKPPSPSVPPRNGQGNSLAFSMAGDGCDTVGKGGVSGEDFLFFFVWERTCLSFFCGPRIKGTPPLLTQASWLVYAPLQKKMHVDNRGCEESSAEREGEKLHVRGKACDGVVLY